MMHQKHQTHRQHRPTVTPTLMELFLLLVTFLLRDNNVDQTKPVSAFLIPYKIRRTTTTTVTTPTTASNHYVAISHQQFIPSRSLNYDSHTYFTSLLLSPPTGTMKLNNGDNEHDVDKTTIASTHPAMMHILIEYCTGCKWNLRAHWMAQELLFHFQNQAPKTAGVVVTVVPSSVAGTFRITIDSDHVDSIRTVTTSYVSLLPRQPKLLWDRTIDVGFPEMDELFDRINEYYETISTTDDVGVSSEVVTVNTITTASAHSTATITIPQPHISIRYGNPNDMFRASYIGQEILSTFHDEVKAVSLIPDFPTISTVVPFYELTVWLNDSVLIYNYHQNGTGGDDSGDRPSRFIPIKELKRLIRDQINPTKDLGHSDVVGSKSTMMEGMNSNNDDEDESRTTLDDDDDDDDDAAELARNYFGVA